MVQQQDRSGALDGLRGIAVLIVFLSHTAGRDIKIAPWLDFAGIGHVGVYLFFVLSGFLLTRTLLEGQSTQTFLIRRFFRIAPLYYAVLIGTFAYQQATGTIAKKALWIDGGSTGLFLSMLFFQGNGVFWTIAAEFAFYALLPIIVWAIARYSWGWVVALSVLSFVWLIAARGFHLPLPPLRFVDIVHPTQYIDVFLCGVAAAYISRPLPHRAIAVAFSITLLLTVMLVSRDFLGLDRPLYQFRWLSLPYGIVFGLTVASVAQGGRVYDVLSSTPLRFVGIVGFSWYLLHLAVFPAVKLAFFDAPGPILFVIATIAVAGASAVTYAVIERPFIRVGRRFECYVQARANVNI